MLLIWKKEKDRMVNINKNFNKYFNINRVDAIKEDDGWKGCLKSHLKCIKYAKDNNLKHIIVMEDDCVPIEENWFNRFVNIKENLLDEKDDWDIFLGGSTKTSVKNITKYNFESNNIYNIIRSHCTHFIVYNHTCYDYFLNAGDDLPIDVVWHKKIKCIIVLPFIFSVSSSYSDISKSYIKIHHNRIIENQQQLINYVKKNNIMN